MATENTGSPPEVPEAFKIANHPEMRQIIRELTKAFNIELPVELTSIFRQCHFVYKEKRGIFEELKGRCRQNNPELLFNMINGYVQEKFCAIYYHYENAVALQKMVDGYIGQIIVKANELGLTNQLGMGISIQKLKYEYEAFILQCRACLDHFADSLAYSFGFYSKNLDTVEKHLAQLAHKNSKAERIVKKIREKPEFYSRLHELLISKTKNTDLFSEWSDRDKIAHSGDVSLMTLTINLNPVTGTKVFHVARQEKGKSVFDLPKITLFMQSFMVELFKFIGEIYEIMLE